MGRHPAPQRRRAPQGPSCPHKGDHTLVAPLGNRLIDVRDRALILIGFAGALRRSELVALDIDDVAEDADGLVLTIRRSKTDQEAEGEIRGLPYGSHPATCPVRAWRAWIDASGIDAGPAFRAVDRHGRMRSTRLSDRAVADMIKRRAAAAGLDGLFAGHSLRSGFATEGYAQGAPELAIMRHGRWKSASVMRGYVARRHYLDRQRRCAARAVAGSSQDISVSAASSVRVDGAVVVAGHVGASDASAGDGHAVWTAR